MTRTPIVRTVAGSVELDAPRVARRTVRPDSDGVTRLRRGESATVGRVTTYALPR